MFVVNYVHGAVADENVLIICCSSFLGLYVCGDASEILCYFCGYLTECSESSNYFCIRLASVL